MQNVMRLRRLRRDFEDDLGQCEFKAFHVVTGVGTTEPVWACALPDGRAGFGKSPQEALHVAWIKLRKKNYT